MCHIQQNLCKEADGNRVTLQCVLSLGQDWSAVHESYRQGSNPAPRNDTEGRSGRLWEDLELPHPRLISGTLTLDLIGCKGNLRETQEAKDAGSPYNWI